jgi:hypothetical protein
LTLVGARHCVTIPNSARHFLFQGPGLKQNKVSLKTQKNITHRKGKTSKYEHEPTINFTIFPLRQEAQEELGSSRKSQFYLLKHIIHSS